MLTSPKKSYSRRQKRIIDPSNSTTSSSAFQVNVDSRHLETRPKNKTSDVHRGIRVTVMSEKHDKADASGVLALYSQLSVCLQQLSALDIISLLNSDDDWPSIVDVDKSLVRSQLSSNSDSSTSLLRSISEYYSFFQQLFLEILISSRLVAQGLDSEFNCNGKAVKHIPALKSISGLVSSSSPLGTLLSDNQTEAMTQLKFMLSKNITLACPEDFLILERCSELMARVLTMKRYPDLISLAPMRASGSFSRTSYSPSSSNSFVPTKILKDIRLLVASDIDCLLWLLDIGQISRSVSSRAMSGRELAEIFLPPLLQDRTKGRGIVRQSSHLKSLPLIKKSSLHLPEAAVTIKVQQEALRHPDPSPSTQTAVAFHGNASDATQSSAESYTLPSGSDSPRSVFLSSTKDKPSETQPEKPAQQTQESVEDLASKFNSLAMEVASVKLQLEAGVAASSSEAAQERAASESSQRESQRTERERAGSRSRQRREEAENPLGPPLPSFRRVHSQNSWASNLPGSQSPSIYGRSINPEREYSYLIQDFNSTRASLSSINARYAALERDQRAKSERSNGSGGETAFRQQLASISAEKEMLARQHARLSNNLRQIQEALYRFKKQ